MPKPTSLGFLVFKRVEEQKFVGVSKILQRLVNFVCAMYLILAAAM